MEEKKKYLEAEMKIILLGENIITDDDSDELPPQPV